MKEFYSKKLSTRIFSVVLTVLLMLSGFTTVLACEEENTVDNVAVAECEKETVSQSIYSISGIALTPGRNASELNFAWYSEKGSVKCEVQISEKKYMRRGKLPENNRSRFQENMALKFKGSVCDSVEGYSSNKVTVKGLKESTDYVYRLGDGVNWSKTYDFSTRKTNDYNFLMVGDPQIGSSNVTTDTIGWNDTIKKAVGMFPKASFLLSAGDQVNTPTNEIEYDGFFSPEELKSLPIASVQGNHDNAQNYTYHFNNPNSSTEYGVTNAGGDYYYTYGDTLFIGLNSNNTSGATHAAFIEEAVGANTDAKWKIVTLHHSIYSSASHSTESSILSRRALLFSIFDKFEIDMVIMGHDHSYTRTYQMMGDQPFLEQPLDENGFAINPVGTVYITANSGTGSKYYTMKSIPEEYAAVRQQLRVPTFSNISVTDNSITISTYRTDTMEQTDIYALIKDPSYTTDYKINNPYETVDWENFGQYKADFHSHSIESDGADEPAAMIEEHYAKDYDVLALTDHNFTNTKWDRNDREEKTYLTTQRLQEISEGSDRDNSGMICIPDSNEQSIPNHLNTFWAPFNNEPGATLEGNIAKCEELGGISHINHPGRYTGGKNTSENGIIGESASKDILNVAKYINLFKEYPSCVGMEIINKKDGDSYSDRILWDSILKHIMPERPVWGFSNDDTHALANTGFSYNMMLMPENTVQNVRYSMENGTFYAVAKVAKRELGFDFAAEGAVPLITNIVVNQDENSILIEGQNYNDIEWIADGKVISTGNTIVINDYEEEIGTYVRAQLKGDGGISFTQPFGIIGGFQPEPGLKQVILSADKEVLLPNESIKLELEGKDEIYVNTDLSKDDIIFKSDISGVLDISEDGTITLINKPFVGMNIKVWAEVNLKGKKVSSNQVVVRVEGESEGHYIVVNIDNGNNDVEESAEDGSMYMDSSDLEIINDNSDQILGTRFSNVSIPKGATIVNAYIQFTVDEPKKSSDPFNVNIHAEAVSDSTVFTMESFNVSSRKRTNAIVSWKDIPIWTKAQEAGEDQRTPNLSTLIQEVIDMDDWKEGNALCLIFDGTGVRSAEAYEGGGVKEAPTLHIIYEEGGPQSGTGTMVIDSVEAHLGKSVDVNVRLENVNSVAGIRANITYDEHKLVLEQVKLKNDFSYSTVNNTVPGSVYFNAINLECIEVPSLDFATLSFSVNANNNILDTIIVKIEEVEACDVSLQKIALEGIDGRISIVESVLPVATDVTFKGECVVGQVLTATYKYSDEKDRLEKGTVIRWLIADSLSGEYTEIPEQNKLKLKVEKEMIGKFIKVEVTPSNAEDTGLPVCGGDGMNLVIGAGDVDKNGVINFIDALNILQFLKDKIVLDSQSIVAGDVQDSDGLNSSDVLKILKVDLGLINLD